MRMTSKLLGKKSKNLLVKYDLQFSDKLAFFMEVSNMFCLFFSIHLFLFLRNMILQIHYCLFIEIFILNICTDINIMGPSHILRNHLIKLPRIYFGDIIISLIRQNVRTVANPSVG